MSDLIHKTSRAFNDVVISPKYGKVSKKSIDFKKLKCEAYWYRNLPSDLQPFAPKFLHLNEELKTIEIEYCPYQTLSELFVTNSPANWKRIVSRLIDLNKYFQFQTSPDLNDEIKKFHLNKTESRLEDLNSIGLIDDLIKLKEININGVVYKNIDFQEIMEDLRSKLCYVHTSVVHGDYCFSNILYDLNSDCVKLIDPRGYLLSRSEPTIYGDSNYDYAKLMHSVHGLYDYIIAKKYSLIPIKEDSYRFEIRGKVEPELLCLLRDSCPDMRVYAYRCLLEVLLFLTMIPLHYEDRKRQVAFYLRAVQLYSSYKIVQ